MLQLRGKTTRGADTGTAIAKRLPPPLPLRLGALPPVPTMLHLLLVPALIDRGRDEGLSRRWKKRLGRGGGGRRQVEGVVAAVTIFGGTVAA